MLFAFDHQGVVEWIFYFLSAFGFDHLSMPSTNIPELPKQQKTVAGQNLSCPCEEPGLSLYTTPKSGTCKEVLKKNSVFWTHFQEMHHLRRTCGDGFSLPSKISISQPTNQPASQVTINQINVFRPRAQRAHRSRWLAPHRSLIYLRLG